MMCMKDVGEVDFERGPNIKEKIWDTVMTK